MKGHVRERGKGNWYAVLSIRDPQTGKRKVRFHSLPDCKTKREAQTACAKLLTETSSAPHISTSKTTLREWVEHWVSIGCPGSKRRKEVGQRSIERYAELLRSYVLPSLGERPLQRLQSSEIDYLYVSLADKISQRTLQHVHSTLGACLGTAMRTGKITKNPMTRLEKVPAPKEPDHGMVLDQDQLRDLVQGFRDRTFFPMVAAAAFTGARRNEILALRWDDLDVASKTLRIERALEVTAKYGSRFKEPKTARGKRTIAIDEDLIALLVAGRENHLRIVAGVPDGAKVDLSLVKLPTDAPMFPGEDFTRPRHPNAVSKEFKRKPTRLGFPGLRFHDLRGTHETLLLDQGVPVHVVAARCGHDPAVLLRSYAKRTKKADVSAAAVLGSITRSVLS